MQHQGDEKTIHFPKYTNNYNDILVKRKPMASGEYPVFARYLRILSRLTWNFVSRYWQGRWIGAGCTTPGNEVHWVPCSMLQQLWEILENFKFYNSTSGESWWWRDYHYNTNTRCRSDSACSFIFPLPKTNCREAGEIVLRMIFTALLGILDDVCLWQ